MRAWTAFWGAIVTGWLGAVWFHDHVSGGWAVNSHQTSDPFACLVWLAIWGALFGLYWWLDGDS